MTFYLENLSYFNAFIDDILTKGFVFRQCHETHIIMENIETIILSMLALIYQDLWPITDDFLTVVRWFIAPQI